MSILEPFNHATFQQNKVVEILMRMGFTKQSYFGDSHYYLDKNGVGVLVELLKGDRFTPSIVLESHYSASVSLVEQPLSGIKDLTDLEDFISYL